MMDMRNSKELKKIFESLDENEQLGVSFGLFPAMLQEYGLDNEGAVVLIDMSHNKTGIEF